MKKKILSVILSVALLAGTVLIPNREPMVVTAIETEPETNGNKSVTETVEEEIAIPENRDGIIGKVPAGTIVLDGKKDAAYANGAYLSHNGEKQADDAYQVNEISYSGTYGSRSVPDVHADTMVLWDGDYIYLFMEVYDKTLTYRSEAYVKNGVDAWLNDAVELWYCFEQDSSLVKNETRVGISSLGDIETKGDGKYALPRSVYKETYVTGIGGGRSTHFEEIDYAVRNSYLDAGNDLSVYGVEKPSYIIEWKLPAKTEGEADMDYAYYDWDGEKSEPLTGADLEEFIKTGRLYGKDPDSNDIQDYAFTAGEALKAGDVVRFSLQINDLQITPYDLNPQSGKYLDSPTLEEARAWDPTVMEEDLNSITRLYEVDPYTGKLIPAKYTGLFSASGSTQRNLAYYLTFVLGDDEASETRVYALGKDPTDRKVSVKYDKNGNRIDYGFNYTVENGKATVTGMDETVTGDVVIPATLGSYPVTSIAAELFKGRTDITSIAIPATVVHIGADAFNGCSGLKGVYITDLAAWCKINFASIYSNPLPYALNIYLNGKLLTDLNLSSNITSVSPYAFYGCWCIETVSVSTALTTIGDRAFYGCPTIESITVEAGNAAYYSTGNCLVERSTKSILLGCKNSILPEDGSIKTIGAYSFSGCTDLREIVIPEGVTAIGEGAFAYAKNLEAVKLPESLTTIAASAFFSCHALKGIVIPAAVTSIGTCAFQRCTTLKNVVFAPGSRLTSFGNSMFAFCTSLSSFKLPDGVSTLLYDTFRGCTALSTVILPASLTSVSATAFSGCTALTTAYYAGTSSRWSTISQYVPAYRSLLGTLLSYAFIDDNGAILKHENVAYGTAITAPTVADKQVGDSTYTFIGFDGYTAGMTATSDNLFAAKYTKSPLYTYTVSNGKATITDVSTSISGNVTIPSTLGGYPVTSIGHFAFRGCTGLTSITIPDSVTRIGIFAFGDCTGLTSITIPDSVTSIGHQAFYNCTGLTSITIPDSVTSIGDDAFWGCTGLTSITIPDSVTIISFAAFRNTGYYNNSSNWENGVLYIGKHLIEAKDTLSGAYSIKEGTLCIGFAAFDNCTSLTSITIPDSVTSIGDYAFNYCTGLTSITIPDSVTSIPSAAFRGCTGLTSITIGNGVTIIGGEAFYGCTGLTSITIPDSVTSIGYYAFWDCTAIKTVYYEGTRAEWDAITFEDDTANPTYYGAELICLGEEDSCANGHDWHGGNCYTPAVCERCGEKTIIHGHNVNPAECNKPSKCQNPGCHYTASGALGHDMTKATCTEPAHCTREGCDHTAGKAKGHKWGEWVREGNIETRVCKNDPTHMETREVEEIKPDKGHREEAAPRPNDDKHPHKAGHTANKNVTVSDVDTNSDSILLEVKLNISEEVVASTVGITADLLNALDGKEFAVGTDVGSLALDAVAAAKLASKNADVSVSLENITNAEETAAGKVVIAINITANGEELLPPDESAENGMLTVTVQYKKGLRIDQVAVSYLAEDGTRETVNVIDYDPVSGLVTFETAHLSDYEISEVNYYTYTELNGGAYITKVDTAISGDVVIPDTIDGLPVIRIGAYAFENCTGITSITLPESLAKLGKYAFAGCTSLEAVIFAENGALTEISDFAFKGCTSLKAVAIPAGVKTIGSNAFFGCESLASVTIPEGVTSIGKYAFAYCTSLASLILPEGLASIGAFAFTGCTALEAIILPESVTVIEKRAFAGCTSLVAVTLPKTVTAIGEYAFYSCASLTTVTIEEGSALASIGANAFRACAALSELALPAGVTVGANAFYGTPRAN